MNAPQLSATTRIVAAWSLLVMPLAPVAAQELAPSALSALEEITTAALVPPITAISERTGFVTFLRSEPGGEIPVATSGSLEQRARGFLSQYGAAFGIRDPGDLLMTRSNVIDELGMEHARFQRTFRGIPITAAEISVHLNGNNVIAVNAHNLDDLGAVQTRPTLSASRARELAISAIAGRTTGIALSASQPRLELFNRGLLDGIDFPTRLAWFIEVTGPGIREFVWIDAQGGLVLLHFNQVPEARDRVVRDAAGTTSGPIVRTEGSPPSGDTDVDLAYDYSGDTYDYYFSEHGRDSYDDAGATLTSIVDYCPPPCSTPYRNAFWNGSAMFYGAGLAAADDVAAHELTHAVTEYTANLFYYMQSGALNESFSDIFGETVDLINGSGTDTVGVRWLLGEDIPGIGAIRNMSNPTAFGDPAKLSGNQLVCDDPGGDAGGVHSNSGVPNHAYTLMVDGGTYNSKTIAGIGLARAGKIQYRALSTYLLSGSGFSDNYHALLQSCTDLIGTDGITSGTCDEVRKALDAVEMNDPWPCDPSPLKRPPLCEPGEVFASLFSDDLEDFGAAHWTTERITGVNHWDFNPDFDLQFSTSGTGHLWGYNDPQRGDSAIEMTSDIAVPTTGAFLQFNHSFGFENSGTAWWDGGVIEYSTNGGSTWSDAGGLIVAGARYRGELNGSTPLGTRQAFVGDSYGYTASQLNLSTLAGKDVRFRLRIGTDSSVDDYGWFIDDVEIYTCDGGSTRILFSDGFESGDTSAWSATRN